MNLQPYLEGELVRMEPLERGDLESLYQSASDPLIWEQHPQSTRYKRDVFEQFFDGAMASGGAFKVIDKANGKIIGSSRYYDYEPARRIIIGYTFLERKYWGGKFNREMKRLMLEYAYQNVSEVLFEIGECNTRSQLAIKKIGAIFLRDQELDGKLHRIYILKKENYFSIHK